MLKLVITRLTALPRGLVLAGAVTVTVVIFCWQIVGLIALQRGNFIDDSALKLKSTGAPTSGMPLEKIATLHLLGDAAANKMAPPMPTVLPKTDLKLVLVGAITDSDPQKASALIQAASQTRRFYVGDNIPGGAALHEVLADSVVLKQNDRYETLLFPKVNEAVSSAKIVERTGAVVAATVKPRSPAGGKNISLRERLQSFPGADQPPSIDQ